MKKIELLCKIISVLLLLFSVTLFSLIDKDVEKIGTTNFDNIKWLDADIYFWRWGWYSLIVGVIFNILSLILRLKGRYRNKSV